MLSDILSAPSILTQREVNPNKTVSTLLAPLIEFNWNNKISSIFANPEKDLSLGNYKLGKPNLENPETENFDILTGNNPESGQYLQFETELLNWENGQNQELSQSHWDTMATIMNTKLAQDANNGETYCQYIYNCQGDSLMTAIMVKEVVNPERTASQIETGKKITKEDATEMYNRIGKDLKDIFPGGILVFDPKNIDSKIPKYIQGFLEDLLRGSIMVNDYDQTTVELAGKKQRFVVLNLQSFVNYANDQNFSLQKAESFMRSAFSNETYDQKTAEGVSKEGINNSQIGTAAFTTATYEAAIAQNPAEKFIQEFVKSIGGFTESYTKIGFGFGLIPEEDLSIVDKAMHESVQRLGFDVFSFKIVEGVIIPIGMPNTDTTKGGDTFAGFASQLPETSGIFKLDTRKGSDSVAMVVDRSNVEVSMGGDNDSGFFVVKEGCTLKIDGRDGANRLTVIILPGGKLEHKNFAPELTTIIDFNPKVGDGPRLASSINSDFDSLTNPQLNPQFNSQFSSQQTPQENTQPFVSPLDFQLNSNPNFGSNDYQIVQKSFDKINPATGEIQNPIQNSNSPINPSIFDNSGNSNNYSNSSNSFDLVPNHVNLNTENLILPRI